MLAIFESMQHTLQESFEDLHSTASELEEMRNGMMEMLDEVYVEELQRRLDEEFSNHNDFNFEPAFD